MTDRSYGLVLRDLLLYMLNLNNEKHGRIELFFVLSPTSNLVHCIDDLFM